MDALKYKVVKTDAQYRRYCNILEQLVDSNRKTKAIQNEIELLNLLIEEYDAKHITFKDADPIELLKSLMKENKLKAVDLARLLSVSEGLVSDMLNYKKGLSKETIRLLATQFRLSQEAFNRPYPLQVPVRSRRRRLNSGTSGRKLRQPG